MPLTTETTPDCQGIVHNASGIVTGDELVEASRAALRLVQNTQNFHYEFVDLSGATALQAVADEHLDRITAQDRLAKTYRPNAVVVIVAPQDDLYELGKEWERRVQSFGWTTHIARRREEALDWLQKNYPPPPRAALANEIASAEPIAE